MRLGKMVGKSVENANEIRADIKTRALLYSAEVQRTFILTYVLFIVVIQCSFPKFADGLGNSVQAWGQLQVIQLYLLYLDLQVVQRLVFFEIKSDAR